MTDIQPADGAAARSPFALPHRIAPVLVAIAAIVAMALLTAGAMLLSAEGGADGPATTTVVDVEVPVDEAAAG